MICCRFVFSLKTTLDADFQMAALSDPSSDDLDEPDSSSNIPSGIYEIKFSLTSPFKYLEFCNSSVTVKILKHLYETNITVKTNYTNLIIVGNMEVIINSTTASLVPCTVIVRWNELFRRFMMVTSIQKWTWTWHRSCSNCPSSACV